MMDDLELRERAARVFGWKRRRWVTGEEDPEYWVDDAGVLWAVGAPLNWTTAGALLEKCRDEGVCIQIDTIDDGASWLDDTDPTREDPWTIRSPLNARSVCEVCVLALEKKDG